MKMKLKIEGRVFNVEIGDLHSRPVIALVDGERFEIWPEERGATSSVPEERQAQHIQPAPPTTATHPNQVTAPLPGVIDEILVQSGDRVEAGAPLCVIEAMKMKNIIYASRAGTIADIKVAHGQQVQHGDVLLTFHEG